MVTKASPWSVADTVTRLAALATAKGMKVFAVIDHSGEARSAGLELRDTKVVIFGSPAAGTPVMASAPLAALDLPLRVLVWADEGGTRLAYTAPAELAARHGLDDDLAARLSGIDALTDAVIGAGDLPSGDAEANRRTIREAFEAWRDGRGAITDVFAAEMVWRIEGRSLAAGDYPSRQRFVDEVLDPFAARFPAAEPFRPVAVRAVHADGDTVIVRWDGRGVATDGEVYENSYAWFMRMAGGRVVEGTAFYDSLAFDDLWTRVPPR